MAASRRSQSVTVPFSPGRGNHAAGKIKRPSCRDVSVRRVQGPLWPGARPERIEHAQRLVCGYDGQARGQRRYVQHVRVWPPRYWYASASVSKYMAVCGFPFLFIVPGSQKEIQVCER